MTFAQTPTDIRQDPAEPSPPDSTRGRAGLRRPTPTHGPHTALHNLRRLWPYVRPAAPRLLISGVLALVAMVCGLAIPLVIQQIIDGPIRDRDLGALWAPAALMVLLGAFEAGLFGFRRWLSARPSMQVQARMRQDLYARLQHLPVAFHDRWSSGQLLSRAVSDLSTIRRFVGFAGLFLFVNTCTFVIGLAILFTLSWSLGLIIGSLALPLIVLCWVYETQYKTLARRAQDQVGDLATTVEESILGIRILKAFGRSAHLGQEFTRRATLLRRTEMSKVRVVSLLWAVIILLPEIAIGLTLFLGIRQVADGTITAGTLVAFFSVTMMLRWPIDSLGWLLSSLNDAASASERFFEVMDAPITVRSPGNPVRLPDRTGAGALRFEGVQFGFDDAGSGRQKLLRGIDLDLRPGQTIALVGATGSGKTTLTMLVNRMYDVTAGRITVDGVDIRDLELSELRTNVSVAFEEPTLFSASVRENITLGRPTATDAEVAAAISIAQADFVYYLPWGLDTRIGEQGLSLSGGQRQRLALARAVIGRPRILVLDDPLSALDIHTEAAVEEALRTVLSSTTALIVAHRASTVLMADQVALLSDGRISQLGTHAELLAGSAAYRRLLRSGSMDPLPRGADD